MHQVTIVAEVAAVVVDNTHAPMGNVSMDTDDHSNTTQMDDPMVMQIRKTVTATEMVETPI